MKQYYATLCGLHMSLDEITIYNVKLNSKPVFVQKINEKKKLVNNEF